MKRKKKEFQKACLTGDSEEKQRAKFRYMASQKKLRNVIKQANIKTIEDRLKKLQEKAKITPNTIWEARKRAKGCKGLEYNTYTEDGILITDPTETKKHIATIWKTYTKPGKAPKNTRAGLST